jgi:hypothetical protein
MIKVTTTVRVIPDSVSITKGEGGPDKYKIEIVEGGKVWQVIDMPHLQPTETFTIGFVFEDC